MPKLFELLGADDPVGGAQNLHEQTQAAAIWLKRIEDLIDGGHRSTEFLWSLHATITSTQRVTPNQSAAIQRMEDEQDNPRRRGASRRYAGFGR